MSDLTDEELMEKFCGGDTEGFNILVLRYELPLVNFLYRYLQDRIDAQEIFQETFLRVLRNARRFDTSRKFKTWLYTIALNLARTTLKQRKRMPTPARQTEEGSPDEHIIESVAACESERADVRLTTEEINREVAMTISQLSEKHREVFLLYQYQGLSYNDIAELLGRPLGTIKSQMHYAVKELKARLREFVSS